MDLDMSHPLVSASVSGRKNIQFDTAPNFRIKKLITRPKVFSIGGCVTKQLCSKISKLVDQTHMWRVTVPCLMSNPSTGRSYYKSDNPDISAHLNLELTKYAKTKLLDEGYDFVFFDPTSDFAGDFWENNGCIINDFTNGLMGTGWSWPDEFDISKWNKIPSKSMHYIEIYIKYLGEFISLMEANGISVICIKRKLCSEVITDAGIVGLGDAEVSRRTPPLRAKHPGGMAVIDDHSRVVPFRQLDDPV
mgnify:CR=1 FL=1